MGHVKDSEHHVIEARMSVIPDVALFPIGPVE